MDTSTTTVLHPSATDRRVRIVTRAEAAQFLRERAGIRFTLSPLTGLRAVEIPDAEEAIKIAKRLRDF